MDADFHIGIGHRRVFVVFDGTVDRDDAIHGIHILVDVSVEDIDIGNIA